MTSIVKFFNGGIEIDVKRSLLKFLYICSVCMFSKIVCSIRGKLLIRAR